MPRRPLISDREIVRLAEDLVRRGSWHGRRIRAAGFEPCPGRPRTAVGAPQEVSLLTALAERTGYAPRTLRRALRELPRAGKVARAPLPEAPPALVEPGPGARDLDAVGLRPLPSAVPAPRASEPAVVVREVLRESLAAALATEGGLIGLDERLTAERLLGLLGG